MFSVSYTVFQYHILLISDDSNLPTSLRIELRSSEFPDDVNVQIDLKENEEQNLVASFSYSDTSNYRINKFHYNIPAFEDEMIWGGGEQYSYLNLREGGNYPIWVRNIILQINVRYLDKTKFGIIS